MAYNKKCRSRGSEINIPLVVAIFNVLQCYVGTGRYLLPSGLDDASCRGCDYARDCIVPSRSGPSRESVSLRTVLVYLVEGLQLAFPPFPSASWIGSLLVNCLFSGLSTKRTFLV